MFFEKANQCLDSWIIIDYIEHIKAFGHNFIKGYEQMKDVCNCQVFLEKFWQIVFHTSFQFFYIRIHY